MRDLWHSASVALLLSMLLHLVDLSGKPLTLLLCSTISSSLSFSNHKHGGKNVTGSWEMCSWANTTPCSTSVTNRSDLQRQRKHGRVGFAYGFSMNNLCLKCCLYVFWS